MTDDIVVNMNFNLGKDQTVTDIIDRLLPFIHDEMRMPAGMIKDVIEEIERLRADLDNVRDMNEQLTEQLQKFYSRMNSMPTETDDIVTRLRESVKNTWADYSASTGKWAMEEAADEIERLRAEVARLNAFLHPIGMVINREVRGD